MEATYHHKQHARLYWLIDASAAGYLAAAWFIRNPPMLSYIFLACGVVLLMIGAGFHHLAVMDEGDQLRIQFGPFPLFATAIRYHDVTAFGPDRTTLMEGWGIQKSFRGGWVWNIWGRDCVVIHHNGITRIGTDDLDNLLELLASRTGLEPSSP